MYTLHIRLLQMNCRQIRLGLQQNSLGFTCLKSVAGKNIDLSYKAGLQINVTTCINFKCLQNCKKYLSNIVVSLLRLLVSLYDSIVNDE